MYPAAEDRPFLAFSNVLLRCDFAAAVGHDDCMLPPFNWWIQHIQ